MVFSYKHTWTQPSTRAVRRHITYSGFLYIVFSLKQYIYIDMSAAPPPIPKRLVTYYHSKETMPLAMKQTWLDMVDKHPDFTCVLMDESEAAVFLQTHFSPQISECFHTLKPQAYKSDVFRYAYMYWYGGIYVDIKYQLQNGFTFHRLLDNGSLDFFVSEPLGIQNCFFACRPRHPLFPLALLSIYESCRTRSYGKMNHVFSCLTITGPILVSHLYMSVLLREPYPLSNALDPALLSFPSVFPILLDKEKETSYPFSLVHSKNAHTQLRWENPSCHCIYWNEVLILQQYKEYRKDLLHDNPKDTRHYSEMFRDRDIYNPPLPLPPVPTPAPTPAPTHQENNTPKQFKPKTL